MTPPTRIHHLRAKHHLRVVHRAKTMHLLIVDDELDICLLLQAILRKVGARCTLAHSLFQAGEALQDGEFDGAIVDIDLPDGRGTQLLQELRERRPAMRLLAISAVDHERIPALAAGADLFLAKPLAKEAILEGLGLPTT